MEKTYYITKEEFCAVKEAWKAKQNREAWEHIIYNILRSKEADNGFCPKTKNIQGNDPWHNYNNALMRASYMLKHYKFSDYFNIEMPEGFLEKLKGLQK